jgi:glycosyltransferase involved in cell wall biosynthesis
MSEPFRLLMIVEQLRRTASGGIGTYVRGLLQGLEALDAGSTAADSPAGDGAVVLPEIELVASRPPSGGGPDPLTALGLRIRRSHLPGPLMTRGWDHGILRAPPGFEVVHATSVATMEPGRAVLVVTVHDLLWRRVPEAYPARGLAWHEHALRRALARADRFIVPAAVVADDLMDAGAPPGSVTVIPMGSDHLVAPDDAAASALLTLLGINGPFLLSVGTLEPRKNLGRLVEAYEAVRDRLPEPWPLLLVGPSGWGKRIEPHSGVVSAGLVSPGTLSALYARARLLAYVPLIEGFGLPPVEAMTFGTPVVASPLPSTEGAAFEVDPTSVESIGDGLVQVASDPDLRRRLTDLGRARSAELTWSGIARRHVEVWEAARSVHGPGARHG